MEKLRTATIAMILGLSGCMTPTLIHQGPQWKIKGRCELASKTTNWYQDTSPEVKCGTMLEVIFVKGGR